MKIIVIVLILSAILSQSCSERANLDSENFSTLIRLPDKVVDSYLIEKSTVIPLETNNNILLGYIFKVIEVEDNIYILDQFRKRIYCFDLKGQFIGKIDNQGKGPFEYIKINDFSVFGDELYILTLNKVIIFNKNNFRAIRETKLDNIYATSLFVGKENFVLSTNNYLSRYILNYTSKENGKILNKELSSKIATNDSRLALTMGGFDFSPIENNNESLFNVTFSENIYTITDTGYHCSYTIDLGDHSIPHSVLEKSPHAINEFLDNRSNMYIRIYKVYKSDDALAVSLDSRIEGINTDSYLVYDNRKTIWYNSLHHKDLDLNVRVTGTSSQGFIGCINSTDLIQKREELVKNIAEGYKTHYNDKKFLNQTTEESNPWLIIFNFDDAHEY